MINTLPTSTLENRLPIWKIENDAIISKFGDITLCYKVELPEVFALTKEDYSTIHSLWVKALKILPAYSIVHKQDWFVQDQFNNSMKEGDDEIEFLEKCSNDHFKGVPFLNHSCYLMITKTSKAASRKKTVSTTLALGKLVPKELLNKEEILKFEEACSQLISLLETSPYYTIRQLNAQDLIGTNQKLGLLDQYLELDPHAHIMHDLHLNPDHLMIGDKYVCLHTLSEAEDFPLSIGQAAKYDNLSTDKSVLVLSPAAPVGLMLDCNHIYNQYVFIDDNRAALHALESKAKQLMSFSKLSRENEINCEKTVEYIQQAKEEGLVSVRSHFNIFSWTDDVQQRRIIKNKTGTAIMSMNCMVRNNTVDAPVLFFSALPGNEGDFPSNDTFISFLEPALCFFTHETNYRDSLSTFGIRMVDRISGRPIHLDISDAPMSSGLITNRNKFILGPSGSGKSFFTNHLMRQYYEQGSHCVIVDIGHSYHGLYQLINEKTKGEDGVYFTYSEDTPIAFNPFYEINNMLSIEKLQTLLSIILTLWKKEGEQILKSEEVVIEDSLNGYYKALREGLIDHASFDTYYEYLRDVYTHILSERKYKEAEFNLRNFLNVMSPYYIGGSYHYLLNSTEQINFRDKKFIVFELDNIKDSKILLPVATLIIMEVFLDKVKNCHGERKVILIEEAWKAIAQANMAEYMKYLFKTVRKHFGEAIIVTQEVDDIIHSEIVRESIINNSDCKILLDQSKFINRFDEIQKLLGLSEKQKAQVLSINQDNDPRRKYKEVYIGLGNYGQVYATEVSPEEYFTYTTEANEKLEVSRLTSELGSMTKALKKWAIGPEQRINFKKETYEKNNYTLHAINGFYSRHSQS